MPMDQDHIVAGLMQHRSRTFAYIWAIVRDDHLAEDVFQEVSILAVRKRDQIDDADHLPRWLRQTARHCARNAVRAAAKRPRVFNDGVLDLLEGEWADRDREASAASLDALRHCLDQLSPYARSLIRLRYHDDLTGERLAEAAGKPMNTVYVALTRTHKTLAECVRNRINDDV